MLDFGSRQFLDPYHCTEPQDNCVSKVIKIIAATAQYHIAHNGRLLSNLSLIGHKLQVHKESLSSSKIIIPIFNSRLVFLTSTTDDWKHWTYGWSVDLVNLVDWLTG